MNPLNSQPAAQAQGGRSPMQRALGGLGTLAEGAAALALFGLMLMSFGDVIGRELFNRPIPGTVELTEIMMAAVVFAVMPSISRRRGHIVVDLLDAYVPRWVRPLQHVLIQLLGCVAFAAIGVMLWEDAVKTGRYGGTTAYFEIPLAGLLYAMALLSGIASAGFLAGVRPSHQEVNS